MATTSAKRPRAPSSPSSSLLVSSSGSGDPPHKASRIIPSSSDFSDVLSTSTSSDGTVKGSSSSSSPVVGSANANTNNAKAPLLCNLPPTCHRQPTPIANTTELERHYAKYHAHVCEERGCGCVFPEARLLDLHQTECHDPLAQIRMERGEKIFQCHIPAPTCGRNFLTPKARRLHLIQAHSYPKEYFFAVTNKGIGGLLKRWGEGASMVRKEWKAREGAPARNLDADMKRYREEESDRMDEDDEDDDDEEEETEEEEEEEEVNEEPNAPFVEEDDEEGKEDAIDLEATPRMLPARTVGITSPQSLISTPKQKHAHPHPHTTTTKGADTNADIAGLVHSLDSLSLVPDSIRFGRGGKTSGFAHGRGGIGHASRGGRGRGGGGGALRGRGRGGEVVGATHYIGQNIAALASGPHGAENPALVPRGVARGRARGSRGRVRGPGRGRGL